MEVDDLQGIHAGVGSASHLCGLLLQSALGSDFNTIAYKGTGPAMIELMGGQIDFMLGVIERLPMSISIIV